MKISQISISSHNRYNQHFKGKNLYFTSDMYGACPCLTSNSACAKNCGNEKIAKFGHPNPYCEVEKVIDGTGNTAHVYWADPMEYLPPKRKRNYFYIVTDKEPPLPAFDGNVETEFFGTYEDRYVYNQGFIHDCGIARDYFYRLETADGWELARLKSNQGNNYNYDQLTEKIHYYQARINESKHRQWQMAECINIYNQAQALLTEKKDLDYEIYRLKGDIEGGLDSRIQHSKKNLAIGEEKVASQQEKVSLLSSKIKMYQEILEINKKVFNDSLGIEKEEEQILKKIKEIQPKINDLMERIKYNTEIILEIKKDIELYEQHKINYPIILKEKIARINEVKIQLRPHYNRLREFCIKQGLRVK